MQTDSSEVKIINTNSVLTDSALSSKEQLGKLLFFEESLSTPSGQSCSSCHDPAVAFADPDLGLPVSRGARPELFGN